MGPIVSYYRNINDFLKVQSGLEISPYSCVYGNMQGLSQFSNYDDIKLPFVISGRLVSVGMYKDLRYGLIGFAPETLQESVPAWVGIEIYSSHDVYAKIIKGEDVSVNEILGKIIKTSWNEKDPGVDFVAEIYDKQVAYKIDNGLIKYISVGFARDIVNKGGQYYFMNIDPKESSLVFDPKDKKAEFKPV